MEHDDELSPVDTESGFARAIREHLDLKSRNSELDTEMPIDRYLNGDPLENHPLFKSERFRRATTDGFFLSIESRDPKFDPERTRRLLESVGGRNIEILES